MKESRPSAEEVSDKNLKETAPIFLARQQSTRATRWPGIWLTIPGTEEDFKPQKENAKEDSTSGQMWKVDIGREWISSQHQSIGKQVTSDPLEKRLRRNTARSWWIALDTMKEKEGCMK